MPESLGSLLIGTVSCILALFSVLVILYRLLMILIWVLCCVVNVPQFVFHSLLAARRGFTQGTPGADRNRYFCRSDQDLCPRPVRGLFCAVGNVAGHRGLNSIVVDPLSNSSRPCALIGWLIRNYIGQLNLWCVGFHPRARSTVHFAGGEGNYAPVRQVRKNTFSRASVQNLCPDGSKELFAADKESGGIILRVCEASATYSARLEKMALEEQPGLDEVSSAQQRSPAETLHAVTETSILWSSAT
jgi:hypothetical protein